MKNSSKTYLFEEMPIPRAIANLSVPTVISSLVYAIMRKIVLEIPAMIILNKLFPLYGLAYAQFCAEIILAIGAVFTINIMFKKFEKESIALK